MRGSSAVQSVLMYVVALLCLGALAAVPVQAEVPAAKLRAGAHFSDEFAVVMKRMPALGPEHFKLWAAAFRSSLVTVDASDLSTNLVLLLPKFEPLWDQNNKLAEGASEKYSKRLQGVPKAAIMSWAELTGAGPLHAAMSLTAEDELFTENAFRDDAFKALCAKYPLPAAAR